MGDLQLRAHSCCSARLMNTTHFLRMYGHVFLQRYTYNSTVVVDLVASSTVSTFVQDPADQLKSIHINYIHGRISEANR